MNRHIRDRRHAQALQEALERFELLLASGSDPAEARRVLSADLGDKARLFTLATTLREVEADVPEPRFGGVFANKLRNARPVQRMRLPAKRFSLTPLALAAAVLAAALILIPSFGSLPGDPLYSLKGASEDVRVWLAAGSTEAHVRISLAGERFDEVERLVERARVRALPEGVSAAGYAGIDDPRIIALIDSTLQDAGEQIEIAAKILTTQPSPSKDLDKLVEASKRGRSLADKVAAELPVKVKPPVLRTAVRFMAIEAKAKAAKASAARAEETPAPGPCAEPTPTPSPSPSPSASPEVTTTPTPSPTPSPTATAEESPTPKPSPTPSATPCVSPSPTPSPTPSASPPGSTEPSPQVTTSADGTASGDERDAKTDEAGRRHRPRRQRRS